MTILVSLDTASNHVRRWDSARANPLTHEGIFVNDATAIDLEGFRATPGLSTQTDAYKAWLRGDDRRPGPWKPSHD